MKRWRPAFLAGLLGIGLLVWQLRLKDHHSARENPGPETAGPTSLSVQSAPRWREIPEGREWGRVGSQSLTEKRLALWKKIASLRSGGLESEKDPLIRLLEQSIREEIARRRFAIHPTPAELENELQKLNFDARASETLAKIELLFEGDRQAFLEEFVRPSRIDSELWNRFTRDPEIHGQARQSALALLDEAKRDPRRFSSLAAAGAAFERGVVSREGASGLLPASAPLPKLDHLPLDRRVLGELQGGALYPELIETVDAVRLLKLGRSGAGQQEVEVWSFPKRRYLDWLAEEAKALQPAIQDPTLKSQVDSLGATHWLRKVF